MTLSRGHHNTNDATVASMNGRESRGNEDIDDNVVGVVVVLVLERVNSDKAVLDCVLW